MIRQLAALSVVVTLSSLSFSCKGVVIGEVPMRITSNAPDTKVEIRDRRINQPDDVGWEEVGVIAEGQSITVPVANTRSIEIRGSADGYNTRKYGLQDPEKYFKLELLEAVGSPGPSGGEPRTDRDINITVELPPFSGDRFVLIIGVSEYQDSTFPPLPNAQRDVNDMQDLMKSEQGGNIDQSRVKVLLNQDATRGRILQELEYLLSRTDEADMVMLYFAGHGEARSGDKDKRYLMAYDSDPGNARTGIDQEELVEILNRSQVAKRQYVVLDCCHAGSGDGDEGPRLRNVNNPESLWDGLSAKGRVVMTSTKGNETALDGPDGENSPFAKAMMEAIRGRRADSDENGLSIDEIYSSVFTTVRAAAQAENGHSMSPQIYGKEWAKDIVLIQK